MKLWPLMSGGRTAKLVFSCSLLLVVALSTANTYQQLADRLESATTSGQLREAAEEFDSLLSKDPALAESLATARSRNQIDHVKALVKLRVPATSKVAAPANASARKVKSNPLYNDPGVQEESNWLDGAIRRLLGLIPRRQVNNQIQLPNTSIPNWIVPGMWILLGLAVLVFGYFVLRHFTWKKALKRKAKAMLEDDEPERTLDEWLALADEHLAAGRFREAVRAMYLSCLLKFDETGIARFIRGETNWEHFERIQASIKLPPGLDFRPPTQAFDRIWYGHHVRGSEDVEQFRFWYQQITEQLRSVAK